MNQMDRGPSDTATLISLFGIAGRLLHVQLFLIDAVQVCRLDVELMEVEILRRHYRKQDAQRLSLADRSSDFSIVHTRLLREAHCDKPRLVALHYTLGITFEGKHPPTSNRFPPSR
jgi:hypothetical protein